MTKWHRRALAVVLVAALAGRVGWAISQPRTAAGIDRLPDQREYLTLADHLRHDGELRLFDPRFGQTVWAYRLPGYPAAIAAVGGSVLGVRLAQAVVDTLTVLGVFVLGRRLVGPNVGIAAAAVIAGDPVYVYFCGLVLTETPFAAAVVWGMVALLPGRGVPARAGFVRPAVAVACFVAAVYLRPTAIVLGPAVALAAGLSGGFGNAGGPTVAMGPNRGRGRAYRWWPAVAVTVGIGLSLVPWAMRNSRVVGAAVWTTTNAGITFYDGFHDGATGASDQRFIGGLPDVRPMTEVARSRELTRRARAWAFGHPWPVAKLAAAKVARGWSPVPLSDQFGRPLYRWVGGTFAVGFDVLCVAGLASRRVRWRAVVLVVTPAIVVTAVQVMTVGSIRYRMPAEAPLAVLAGAGAVAGWERARAFAGLHTPPPV